MMPSHPYNRCEELQEVRYYTWYNCAVIIPGICCKFVTFAPNTLVVMSFPAVSVLIPQGLFLG